MIDYVLPIKSNTDAEDDELTRYLEWLAPLVNLVVVDASPPEVFDARAARWNGMLTHLAPANRFSFANGKVNGVLTGIGIGAGSKIVIADEDIRYDAAGLCAVGELLDSHDLVIPQNYFSPAPWHARWDTARSLLNRLSAAGDFPGTLALRRTEWLERCGYDGDVLFENLELIRTVQAHAGSVHVARELYVRRLPPAAGHFRGQRVRQAYDSQAQPLRLVAELAVLPAAIALLRHPRLLASTAAAAVALAEGGRRRDGGRTVFPASAPLFAPLWILERGVCSWLAVATRVFRGGVKYSGGRITRAAHSVEQLRRAASASDARSVDGSREQLVAAVAERLDG